MSRSSDERCRQEVIRSKDMLEDKLEQSIRHFSYPWGQFSARTTRILRTLNVYDSVATIDRGSMSNHGDPILLRRDRADLYRSGVELENIMRLADRLYALRLLKPSELKKRVQGESIEWQAMDRDDDQGDTGTTSL
jgi:peptidoglycan/xylan/chitin deacetylase (PgdA/CDA1 family)